MSIDLHIHSTMSDGTLSPREIVQLAYQKGLKAIAITDHDTFDGVQEALETAMRVGLETISGVELSVKKADTTLHLLGYGFDHHDQKFSNALKKIQCGRVERNVQIIERLKKLKFQVSYEEVKVISKTGLIGRPHIARLLLTKGYVSSMDEAFELYLGSHGSAYVNRPLFRIPDAIGYIKNAGGLAVLAHPYNIYRESPDFELLIDELIAMGLDGIEAYYPAHTRKFRKDLIRLAANKKILITGGSDYHGDIRPGTTLAGGKNVTVPYSLLKDLKSRLHN